MGGSNPRILETAGKLQILQEIAVLNHAEGSINPADGNLVYVGITPNPSHRVGMDENEKKKNKQKELLKSDSGIVKGG